MNKLITYEDIRFEFNPTKSAEMRKELTYKVFEYLGVNVLESISKTFKYPDRFAGRFNELNSLEFDDLYPYWRVELSNAGFDMMVVEHCAQR